ncbi:MAG TPA: hypothetical protein V6D43_21040 [Candidatus Sericytochromatia bacterium]|jgi:hypothetical protein
MEDPTQVEKLAQEVATKYRQMRYTLGSTKKYRVDDILKVLNDAEKQLCQQDQIQMRERFHELVGLNGDRKSAHDKLHRDFPGNV